MTGKHRAGRPPAALASRPGAHRGLARQPHTRPAARANHQAATPASLSFRLSTLAVGALAIGIAGIGAAASQPTGSDEMQATRATVMASPHARPDARRRTPASRGYSRLWSAQDDTASEQLRRASVDRRVALARLSTLVEKRRRYLATHQLVVPVATYRITATFGATSSLWSSIHTGVDLAAPTGTPVAAAVGGVVTGASYDGAYGNKITITDADGTETWYAHLNTIEITIGTSVEPGDLIGTVGATGNVTGPHLHLEVRPGGAEPVDPVDWFQARGLQL